MIAFVTITEFSETFHVDRDMCVFFSKSIRSDSFFHWFVLLRENDKIVVLETWRTVEYDVVAIEFLYHIKIWHNVFNDIREKLKKLFFEV